jgi:1-deoxy-D-xylulose-5-phosphate synthase
MLHDALELDTPVAIRWPKTPAPSVTPDQVGHGLLARKVSTGDGTVCLVGVGKMLAVAEAAAELLAADGIEATVWDPRVVKPLDPALIDDAARHRLLVTIEDGLADGGAGQGVADAVAAAAFGAGGPAVRVLGLPTAYLPHGKPDAILAANGLDAEGVVQDVRASLKRLG